MTKNIFKTVEEANKAVAGFRAEVESARVSRTSYDSDKLMALAAKYGANFQMKRTWMQISFDTECNGSSGAKYRVVEVAKKADNTFATIEEAKAAYVDCVDSLKKQLRLSMCALDINEAKYVCKQFGATRVTKASATFKAADGRYFSIPLKKIFY